MNLIELVATLQTEENAAYFFQQKDLRNRRKCVNGQKIIVTNSITDIVGTYKQL